MAEKTAKPAGAPPPTEAWAWPEEKWRAIVNKVRAGRSLKPATWKGGARCAVALSFDSDHETTTLRFADTSPGRLSAGEYGSRVGVPRILRLLTKYDIKASFFVPAVTALLHPDEQKRVIAEGHEIGIHSWIHEFNSQLPPKDERDLQLRAADVLEKVSGVRPVGIRTPSWDFSSHTLAITREMGLLYDSSLMADDEPYEILEDGKPTGIVNVVLWASKFERFRREVMGARLMVVEGRIQKSPEDVIHLMAERIFDRSGELDRLSDTHTTAPELAPADEFLNPQSPRGRHPRDVRVLPKSRDFH